jgi:hypothetical protein
MPTYKVVIVLDSGDEITADSQGEAENIVTAAIEAGDYELQFERVAD